MSPPDADAPPPGFEIRYPDEPFEMHVGPHYFRADGEGIMAGFRAKPNHANHSGNVHGGALSAFADSALTGFALHELGSDEARVVTITLNCEFVSPATVGDWIECRGQITKRTRSLIFVRGTMTVQDRIILTCSSVLRCLT